MGKVVVVILFIVFASIAFAGSSGYYSGMSAIDKETCDRIAKIGHNKGQTDRRYGIRDNNKWEFVEKICPKCGITAKAEIATCYEIGYDMGYYGR